MSTNISDENATTTVNPTIKSRRTDAATKKQQRRLNFLRTLGINYKLIEREFIDENSHCHLCSADMNGPCAWYFRVWMGCASALDNSDKNDPNSSPNLIHKSCQGALNKYIQCCNRYIYKNPSNNNMGLFPWFLWSQKKSN
mmetsp:Transcript_59929/g.73413  ORF Transcript_59929/g.73413 Transcript_59929/m.73413 type:complete len:141 (+) Transcript_59929:35-457(+)